MASVMHSVVNAALIVLVLAVCVQSDSEETCDIVATESGMIKGFTTPKCTKFLGIPYATAERFADPVPIHSWTDTLDATITGPMCYQRCPPIPENICETRVSEDCLFLNVFRPLAKKSESYAVMVFFHGGNFDAYSGGSPLYDGETFVSTGEVILVTINYRLGAFGFLATVDDGQMVSGNFGLKDQVLALKWVQDNIHYFGGSTSKITLFGQSAGAQSVVLHLLSPSTSELFHQVIIQSCPFTIPFRNATEASRQTRLFSENLHCQVNDLHCYRTKTAEEIQVAAIATTSMTFENILIQFQPFGPVMDGKDVPRILLDGIKKAQKLGKNIIVGTTTQEGAEYASSIVKIDFPLEIGFPVIAALFPSIAPAIQTLYADSSGTRALLTRLITDYVFYCSSRQFANLMTSHKDTLWFYIFNQPITYGDETSGCKNMVCHGADLPYVFGTNDLIGRDATEQDKILISRMINYWTDFAKFGTPNSGKDNNLLWPIYRNIIPNGGMTIYFEQPDLVIKAADRNTFCEYFDTIGYHFAQPFGPVMDGKDVPRILLDGIKKAQKLGKNIIVGTTTQEGAEYASSIVKIDFPLEIGFPVIAALFPSIAPAIQTLYADSSGTRALLTRLITDYVFYCSSRQFANLMTSHKDTLWFYIFNQPITYGDETSGCKNMVCHGADLPYVFGTNDLIGRDATEQDKILISRMINYWTDFAKFGTPNSGKDNNLLWPIYRNIIPNGGMTIYFEQPDLVIKAADRNTFCEYFDTIGYHFAQV